MEEGGPSLPRERSLFSVLAILGAPGPAFNHQARPLSLCITSRLLPNRPNPSVPRLSYRPD
jgi:hypothetical protein